MSARARWAIGIGVCGVIVGYCVWLVWTNAPAYQFLVRLYVDKHFLKRTLREWGVLAPVIFILLQALQVIISPIPGEATGILGGYLFGQWMGLFYSTIGLTIGSVVAFWIGRWLGAHYVKNLVSAETWNRLGFIVEAEGAVWDQPHAPLGLRPGLGLGPHPGHLGALGPGGPHRGRRLHAGHPGLGGGGGGGPAALLLPASHRDLVPGAEGGPDGGHQRRA
jgi:hypothetical protein